MRLRSRVTKFCYTRLKNGLSEIDAVSVFTAAGSSKGMLAARDAQISGLRLNAAVAGTGETSGWLKALFPTAHTTAVEINGDLLPRLKTNIDLPIIGSLDEVMPKLSKYDLLLCLDILEHLPDPLLTLTNLHKEMKCQLELTGPTQTSW